MWEILQRLKTRSQEPWVVIGDFNEAMWQYEHFSNTKRGERQMAEFREALDLCGLTDLGFSGIPWTYDNKKSGARNVKVRLDRAVATQDWANRFFLCFSYPSNIPLLRSLSPSSLCSTRTGSATGRKAVLL